jgi:hypothetical protein
VGSKEEANPLKCSHRHANKSPLQEASAGPPKLADALVIDGSTL